MQKQIIGVFQDSELLRLHTEALEEAGHNVCPACNLIELKQHLEAKKVRHHSHRSHDEIRK